MAAATRAEALDPDRAWHRRDVERTTLATRLVPLLIVPAILSEAPAVEWATGWQPGRALAAALICLPLAVSLALGIVALRRVRSRTYPVWAAAQTGCFVASAGVGIALFHSVGGIITWPVAIVPLLGAAARHRTLGILLTWAALTGFYTAVCGYRWLTLDHPLPADLPVGAVLLFFCAGMLNVQSRQRARYLSALDRARAELRQRALHDPLTGLPNRAALSDWSRTQESTGATVAVVVLDLNGFKPVNDTFGHQAGDRLLQTMAARLRLCVRAEGRRPGGPADLVVRLGGDEFALALPADTAATVDGVVDRIREAIAEPAHIDGHEVRVTTSVGVARGTLGSELTVEQLLRDADSAMYADKAGRPVRATP